MAIIEQPTESSPLIPDSNGDEHAPKDHDHHTHSPEFIVILLCVVIFALTFSTSLITVPSMRLIEDILCRKYYSRPDVDETMCKIGSIQTELAYLTGLVESFTAVAGILLAFPYGLLADRIGRRPVFILCVIGETLRAGWILIVLRFWTAIPLYAIIFAPLFNVIGGGNVAFVAVILSMAADVVKEEDRASAFLKMHLTSLIGNLIGPVVSSKLMELQSPWVPLILTMVAFPVGSMSIFFVPETLKILPREDNDDPPVKSTIGASMKAHAHASIQALLSSSRMLKNINIALLLLPFLIDSSLVLANSRFLIQYISLRFNWSLSTTGYLLGIQGAINILLFLAILPALSYLLISPKYRFSFSAARKDYTLLVASILVLLLGSTLISLPLLPLVIIGIIFVTLGGGLPALCRSLITSFIDAQHTTQLYSLIGIIDAVGAIYAGPAMAWLLNKGMQMGGNWLGLPYWWLVGCVAVVGTGLCFVRVDDAVSEREDGRSEP